MTRSHSVAACLLAVSLSRATGTPTFSGPVTNGVVNISGLSEASGVVSSRNNDSVLWTHNDSGHPADVYAIDTQGRLLGTYGIPGNSDNEDIAIGPGPVTNISYLYIGDIGDNGLTRAHIKVYQIPEPAVYARDYTNPVVATSIKGARTITLTYPDGTNNAEAMFVDPQSGDLWILTKASTSRIYMIPKSELDTNNNITLTFVQTLAFNVPSGADISPSGNEIVVRQENFARLWLRASGQSISSAFQGTAYSIPVTGTANGEPNGEAIGFDFYGSGYFTMSDSATTQPLRYFSRTSNDGPQPPVSLVPEGSDWQYLDDGSNQGTAWYGTNFNDSSWKTGTGQFGYGDGDEKTIVSYGANANNKFVTTYFRKTFVATNTAAMQSATLKMVVGHGAIAYLNGTPVVYEGLNSNATYTTLATVMPTSLQSTWHSYSIDPALLVDGTNTIAVEIHQYSSNGTNMSFDAEISANAPAVYEPLNYAVNTSLVNVTNASGNWWAAAGSGASPPAKVVSGNLPVSGLQLYKGNSLQFGAVEGPSARFNMLTNITAGIYYYSLAFKVTDLGALSTSGGFTAGFNNSRGSQGTTPTVVATRILTRATGTGGYNIGTGKNSSTSTDFVWATNVFTTNDTVFIVGSYEFNTGSTTDDVSSMWINPDPSTFGAISAPTPTLVAASGSDISSSQIASFVCMQRGNQITNTVQPGLMIVDELRFGFLWSSVTPPGPTIPSIIAQPQSQTVIAGTNVSFSVTASSPIALNYQWQFGGAPINGATQSSYTRSSVASGDAGSYSVIVSNLVGTVTSSNAVLIVNTPPSISFQPQSATLIAGSNAVSTVTASGTTPLSYQWRFNLTPISGATISSYTRANISSSDIGSYSVVITNVAGSTISSNAVLVVNTPPLISGNPTSQTVGTGASVSFSVIAEGTAPLLYQWFFNSGPISGATTSAYSVTNAQPANVGSYSVLVTNIAGSATSTTATLTVLSGAIGLSNMTANADGSIGFVWLVDAGLNYTFQYKSNLLDSYWTTIGVFSATSNSLALADNPAGASQRFYQLFSDSAISQEVGFLSISMLGDSDTFVSLPFERPGASSAVVGSVSANVINISGSPNWSTGQFVYASGSQSNTYYVRLSSGVAEGRIYRITNNTVNSLSVDLGGDSSIGGVTAGDSLVIEPYWTLATAFPNGAGVNISPTLGTRNSELLIPDTTSAGINLSATKIYFFNAGTWKQVGQGTVNYDADLLLPNMCFIVRHNVLTNTVLTMLGSVVTSKLWAPLQTFSTNPQDNALGLLRPIPVSLNASGLISSGAFNSSPLPGNRTDELLTFDNSVANRNKSASAVYYYWSNAWRQVGAGSADVGNAQVLGASAGFIIRKGTNSSAVIWTNTPNY